MKKLKKSVSVLLIVALFASLAACGSKDAAEYTVGICQLVSHDAHDEATKGFMDAIEEALPGKVRFLKENAANEISACSTIINTFLAEDVDLILANATPALQVAAAATDTVPVLGTSITKYDAILGLEVKNGILGGNVSGTSDLASLEAQAQMVKTWFPNIKTVGLLYCSAEVNSQYQVEGMKKELETLGYTCKFYPFIDSNDLAGVTQSAADSVDLIYVPTDNTVAANAPIIDNICRYERVPVIGGDEGICAICTVATLCIDYYALGYLTGQMAVKILTGEENISQMPIAYAEHYGVFNEQLCKDLGLSVPQGYKATQS